jgi:hypothetical protein
MAKFTAPDADLCGGFLPAWPSEDYPMNVTNPVSGMSLEEARAIVESQDAQDPGRALEAVALILRFNGISKPRLVDIAKYIEQVAREHRDATKKQPTKDGAEAKGTK